jgi:putative ABC transport system permease protein
MNVVFVSPSYYPAETAPTAASPGQGTIRYGVFFTEAMAKSGERVCVLDTEATRVIFGDRNGVGETIRVNGVPFRVIGTMAGGSTTGRWGGREELWSGNILIPIAQYEEVLPALLSGGGRHYEDPMAASLYVHAADEASVPGAAQQLRRALGRVMPGDLGRKLFLSEPTYGSLREYFALRGSAARRSVLTAALLLLIALVGLTNTLLVSLGERTRELGIRRALGALKSQVLLSLLAEALWLAALGCAAGVIVAWLLSLALRPSFASSGALLLSAFWAVAACLTMLVASAFASAIPGVLATRVNPAQALRQE